MAEEEIEQLETYYGSMSVDMKAMIGDDIHGVVGQIWFTTSREMAPIYGRSKSRNTAGRILFYNVINEEYLKGPFDIIFSAANEYGDLAIMKFLRVELMDKGYTVETVEEKKEYTFITEGIIPWHSVEDQDGPKEI